MGNVWNDSLDCEESERDRECNPLHLNLAVPFSLSDLDLPMALRKGNR